MNSILIRAKKERIDCFSFSQKSSAKMEKKQQNSQFLLPNSMYKMSRRRRNGIGGIQHSRGTSIAGGPAE
jgi:hypothetical protein